MHIPMVSFNFSTVRSKSTYALLRKYADSLLILQRNQPKRKGADSIAREMTYANRVASAARSNQTCIKLFTILCSRPLNLAALSRNSRVVAIF